MTAYQLFRGLTGVDGELLAAVEPVDSAALTLMRQIWAIFSVIFSAAAVPDPEAVL